MYLKSTHSPLPEGGHQWEITLFCSTEANTIAHVDITPKSRASKVIPNDAKPAPTAYTMTYTSSKFEEPPYKFIAVITFKIKDNRTKKKIIKKSLPPPPPKKKKRALCSVFNRSKNNTLSEKDDATQKCCCTIIWLLGKWTFQTNETLKKLMPL
ncbi:40073_t:CDS:2 [Gigaspora margarita]|uniref:40073_t:CDS:1 n=1 Tax=Gigaspora margarita TaxID=4874 RepID=A0ABN7ULL1_GIGMA|nr:40073_t:CDS:2 [Gigaspora margarita]